MATLVGHDHAQRRKALLASVLERFCDRVRLRERDACGFGSRGIGLRADRRVGEGGGERSE
jgi:hypothetical protein